MKINKILSAFLILLVAVLLQMRAVPFLGFAPNFTLAILLVFIYFFNIGEILLWSAAAIVLLAWPSLSWEMAMLFILPFSAGMARRFLPWRSWLDNLLLTFISFIIFYLAIGPELFLTNYLIFIQDVIISLIFGSAILQLFNLYQPMRDSRQW